MIDPFREPLLVILAPTFREAMLRQILCCFIFPPFCLDTGYSCLRRILFPLSYICPMCPIKSRKRKAKESCICYSCICYSCIFWPLSAGYNSLVTISTSCWLKLLHSCRWYNIGPVIICMFWELDVWETPKIICKCKADFAFMGTIP